MGLEIERKFLVVGDFRKEAASRTRIVQGYICSERGRTVRVRLRSNPLAADAEPVATATNSDGVGYLTIKGPSVDGGLTRYEFEKQITVDEALSLLRLCQPGIVDKVRWLVPMPDGHTFEVDEFHGENEGLIMAEVELGAADEPFLRPAWLGEEVTGDRRYYNSQLRQNPFTKW